jgi:hypothetical protein
LSTVFFAGVGGVGAGSVAATTFRDGVGEISFFTGVDFVEGGRFFATAAASLRDDVVLDTWTVVV